jgi:hypothetical protein
MARPRDRSGTAHGYRIVILCVMPRAVLSVCCAVLILGSTACTGTHHRGSPPSTTSLASSGREAHDLYRLAVAAIAKCDPTAAGDLRKAIALNPGNEPALYLYGAMRYNASDWNEAVTYLRRAVTANRLDANAHWLLGLSMAHFHGPEARARESARHLREALRLDPSLRKQHATTDRLNAAGAHCRPTLP